MFGFQLAFPTLLWLYHFPLFDCGDRGEAALASSAVIICGGKQASNTVSLHANSSFSQFCLSGIPEIIVGRAKHNI